MAWGGLVMAVASRQEEEVMAILKEYGLEYEYEKTWWQCRDQRTLPFDFYLPKYNMVIEIDGIQHFEAQKHFGGDEGLALQQKHDRQKDEYCKREGIGMVRIPYYMDTRKGMKRIISRAIRESMNYGYYINTDGCYVVSDYRNLVVCHRCEIDDADAVDVEGPDLHIKYLEGNMSEIISLCKDDIRYIIFERNEDGVLRYMEYKKLRRKLLGNI